MDEFDHKKLTLDNSIFIGSIVLVKGSNLSGIVVKLEKNGTKCHVEVNGKILKLETAKVTAKKPANGKKQKTKSKSSSITRSDKSISVDLHGMTKDQATECLISFLDRALLQNVGKIEIIHGHGHGILKKEVHRFLKESQHIASFKILEHNTGTTCGYLK